MEISVGSHRGSGVRGYRRKDANGSTRLHLCPICVAYGRMSNSGGSFLLRIFAFPSRFTDLSTLSLASNPLRHNPTILARRLHVDSTNRAELVGGDTISAFPMSLFSFPLPAPRLPFDQITERDNHNAVCASVTTNNVTTTPSALPIADVRGHTGKTRQDGSAGPTDQHAVLV